MNGVINVVVLMGGIGSEREVSLVSGRAVATALQAYGMNVHSHDLHPDNLSILDNTDIDVFFPALHGTFGEDGQLQRIMEDKGLCFVGSGAQACALTFDKQRTKQVVQTIDVPTPEAVTYSPESAKRLHGQVASWKHWVVKPICEGSSVGVTLSDDLDEVMGSAAAVFAQFGNCMIERFVKGREVTVGVVLGDTLPVIEVKPAEGFYDYQAKYEADNTQYLFNTLPDAQNLALQRFSEQSFSALEMRHFGRIDFLVDDEGGAWFLEANAIPGLTDHSLLPKAAQQVGVSMSELCGRLVEAALSTQPTAATKNLG